MVMGTGIRELSGMINGVCLGDPLCNPGAVVVPEADDDPESFFNHNGLIEPPLFIPEAIGGAPRAQTIPAAGLQPAAAPCSEDADVFSDIALSYISEILMEEEMDDRAGLLPQQIGPALRDAVQPFYEVLLTPGNNNFPPPSLLPLFCDASSGSPDEGGGGGGLCSNSISSGSPSGVLDDGCRYEFAEQASPGKLGGGGGAASSVDYASQTSFGSSDSAGSLPDLADGPLAGTTDEELLEQLWQYNKGMEEAIKFLPDQQKLIIDVRATSSPTATVGRAELLKAQTGSRHRKNPHHDDGPDPEELGRSAKHTAVVCCSDEEDVPQKMFDDVLLCPPGRPNEAISSLREALQIELGSKGASKNGHGGRSRGRRQPNKKEVVDLRTLLIHCAQAVATDDRRSAGELLKQIRQHSSADGDGSQRLAHCFADGLEARMAGTGAELYRSLAAKTRSAASILKAYHLYLAACPFKKVSHFMANQTILNVADGASRLHIVDFGIYFGFQWPCLIQRLSLRAGGPPKLRITGIELPQPGFRPAERVEETGRRLAEYARRFGVPFEYRPIAARWEDIEVGDLGIGGGGAGEEEVLVVNCLYKFKNLVDETVVAESPRDGVLERIRRMRPDLFVHGVVNGAYGAPFFATRFREALFHFSALFDMLETTVPREHAERGLIEREILGREATNVIACEGGERVERPETYKQWQARNLRAGLVQLPLHQGIVRKAKDKVRNCYHRDFLVDEDGGWLLQGWKGRLLYALSTWAPAGGGGFRWSS